MSDPFEHEKRKLDYPPWIVWLMFIPALIIWALGLFLILKLVDWIV